MKIEMPDEMVAEAKDMLELSYIKHSDKVPDYMKKQKKLVMWAKKTAELIANYS